SHFLKIVFLLVQGCLFLTTFVWLYPYPYHILPLHWELYLHVFEKNNEFFLSIVMKIIVLADQHTMFSYLKTFQNPLHAISMLNLFAILLMLLHMHLNNCPQSLK